MIYGPNRAVHVVVKVNAVWPSEGVSIGSLGERGAEACVSHGCWGIKLGPRPLTVR